MLISSLFFVCLSRVGMTKFVITETLWISVIFKTIMVSLHRGRFVVVHLYSTFLWTPGIFLYRQIYTKITFFAILRAVSPHFKATTVKFATKVRTWNSLPTPNFVKKSLRGIYPFGSNLYHKIPILVIWRAVCPILKWQQWNLVWGCGPGTQSPCQILYKKIAKGDIPPLGQIYSKNYQF